MLCSRLGFRDVMKRWVRLLPIRELIFQWGMYDSTLLKLPRPCLTFLFFPVSVLRVVRSGAEN